MTRDTPDLEPDHGLRSTFRREGEYWTVAFAGATCRLRDSAGLRHVAYLLARPGERVTAVELVVVEEGRQYAVDGRQLEDRSNAQRESPPADSASDTADCLPPTAYAPTVERARVRVTHAIRHTLRRIEAHHAELNEHLRATIKTGTRCAYLPDPRKAVQWEL